MLYFVSWLHSVMWFICICQNLSTQCSYCGQFGCRGRRRTFRERCTCVSWSRRRRRVEQVAGSDAAAASCLPRGRRLDGPSVRWSRWTWRQTRDPSTVRGIDSPLQTAPWRIAHALSMSINVSLGDVVVTAMDCQLPALSDSNHG